MAPELLGLLADSSTRFELAHAQGELGWLLYVFIAVGLGLAWWAWKGYGPAPGGLPGRIARCCRVAAILVGITLLTGPTWTRTTILSEPGKLLVVVDQSASMAATDGFADDSRQRTHAAKLLHEALTTHLPADSASIQTWAIGGSIRSIKDPGGDLLATGAKSAIGNDIEHVIFAQRPDAAILVSDGRITEGSRFTAVAKAFKEAGLPRHGIWTLAVGSSEVEPELHIDEVICPRDVPLGERQPVLVKFSGRALSDDPIIVRIREGDKVLEETTLEPPASDDDLEPINLEQILNGLVLHTEGDHRLQVELEQGALRADTAFTVQVQSRPLTVLLLAHRPRYELRYLKEALRRDRNVDVHTYLCDGRWRPWGQVPAGLKELPLGAETIKAYDVIVIGDFGPDRLTDPEIGRIAKAVKEDGAGLIWLPGEAGSTARYRGTELGKLLPVRLPSSATIAEGYASNTPITIERTEEAVSQGLLEGDGTAWDRLPQPMGACPVDPEDGLVPGARVLLQDKTSEAPLVVVRDFGAGKGLFVGIDDSWRWRREVGDKHLHHFWSQLLRYVSSNRSGDRRNWRIIASPQRAIPGQLVQVGIVPVGALPDSAGLPRQITVKLSGPGGTSRLATLDRPAGESSWLARLPAPQQGTWTLEALDLPQPADEAELIVLPPGAEIRDPRIDAIAMAELASDTGGRDFLLDPSNTTPQSTIDELVKALPGLAKEKQRVDHETVWDNWWALALLVALLSVEWAIRRWFRLP